MLDFARPRAGIPLSHLLRQPEVGGMILFARNIRIRLARWRE